MSYNLRNGDSKYVLRSMPDDSFDSCVTDPPYELTSKRPGGRSEATRGNAVGGFMGKKWDGTGISFDPALWAEGLRVLKPGAYIVAFGGTRTYHRMVCAIEDAGFEIRDQISWMFGTGFPKSKNLPGGLGTALKPGFEPVVLARKPFKGSVQENYSKYGTGVLFIDRSRIPIPSGDRQIRTMDRGVRQQDDGWGMNAKAAENVQVVRPEGRWPANILHDGSDEVIAIFPESKGQQGDLNGQSRGRVSKGIYGDMPAERRFSKRSDSGSAARFFYNAKASRTERDAGCEEFALKACGMVSNTSGQHVTRRREEALIPQGRNTHPTVKPIAVMRYLVNLVTPPGGHVLDCFNGSGSTGCAAVMDGFNYTGIELDPEMIAISRSRIEHATSLAPERKP